MKNLHLFKCRSERVDEEGKRYQDFFLAYEFKDKTYLVRVKPCFNNDYKLLGASAQAIESVDNYNKYM